MDDSAKQSQKNQSTWKPVDFEALLVPFLALVIQAGYAATDVGRITLLSCILHPIMLLAVAMVGFISYLLLRPFRRDESARAFVFLICVVAFAAIACFLTAPTIVKVD